MYKIENNIPCPPTIRPGRDKSEECETFSFLNVGESFFVPSLDNYRVLAARIYQQAHRLGRKAAIRRIPGENGVRVFRIK
jgi:hypothetical protein